VLSPSETSFKKKQFENKTVTDCLSCLKLWESVPWLPESFTKTKAQTELLDGSIASNIYLRLFSSVCLLNNPIETKLFVLFVCLLFLLFVEWRFWFDFYLIFFVLLILLIFLFFSNFDFTKKSEAATPLSHLISISPPFTLLFSSLLPLATIEHQYTQVPRKTNKTRSKHWTLLQQLNELHI